MNRRAVVEATWWQTWSVSLFGMPKLAITCGACGRYSKDRSRVTAGIVWAPCRWCGVLNVAKGLVLA